MSEFEEVLETFFSPQRLERFDFVLEHRTSSTTVVLDHVHHAHNISAVLRSADAFGLADVHLIGNEFQFARTISLGAERWLKLYRHQTAEDALTALRNDGYKIVILEAEEKAATRGQKSCAVYDLPFESKLALVFGSEKLGVSSVFREQADLCSHIPMFGFVESFNISVAAAITLFCSTISGATNARRPPLLDQAQREELRCSWLKGDHRHADIILRELARRNADAKR